MTSHANFAGILTVTCLDGWLLTQLACAVKLPVSHENQFRSVHWLVTARDETCHRHLLLTGCITSACQPDLSDLNGLPAGQTGAVCQWQRLQINVKPSVKLHNHLGRDPVCLIGSEQKHLDRKAFMFFSLSECLQRRLIWIPFLFCGGSLRATRCRFRHLMAN